MRIILAPMQGVLDSIVRELLTEINDYDLCITEFVRVVDQLLPTKTFYRISPELYNSGYTKAKTPVRVQLLGQSPNWLAENAMRAIELGSHGIDLNCGCPSKTVNGSYGGAFLLQQPESIYKATKAIRQAVSKEKTVSVKIRLGWDSTNQAYEIADAIQQAGANEIFIHARTKVDGYKVDKIKWHVIGELVNKISIPIIANGEIFNYNDLMRCQTLTQTESFMLARGALTIPNLANVLKYQQPIINWHRVSLLLYRYFKLMHCKSTIKYPTARIKQWLKFLITEYSQANNLFKTTRTCEDLSLFAKYLSQETINSESETNV